MPHIPLFPSIEPREKAWKSRKRQHSITDDKIEFAQVLINLNRNETMCAPDLIHL